jgi:hypothetical protein
MKGLRVAIVVMFVMFAAMVFLSPSYPKHSDVVCQVSGKTVTYHRTPTGRLLVSESK